MATEQLTNGFVAYLECPFDYEIEATEFSADGTTVFLTFTFRSGHRYCCLESGCHHGLLFDSDYERLRSCFRQAGVNVAYPMKLHMNVVCESGALFVLAPSDSRPRYKAVSEGWTREEVYNESEAEHVSETG